MYPDKASQRNIIIPSEYALTNKNNNNIDKQRK